MIGAEASDFRELRRAARRFGPELDRRLKKELKDAGDYGVKAVRRKLDVIPVSGGPQANRGRRGALRRGSLRATLKRNTRTQVLSQGVRIVQGAQHIRGRNAKGLPRRLNADVSFRHPVFGDEDEMVSQRPWRHFDAVLRGTRGRVREGVERALSDAAETIARG